MNEIVPPSSQLNRPRKRAAAGQIGTAGSDLKAAKSGGDLTPLAYMLAVINDPDADYSRRDKLAVAALPFCHPRIADREIGKRDRVRKTVEAIINGDGWGDVIRPKPDIQFDN